MKFEGYKQENNDDSIETHIIGDFTKITMPNEAGSILKKPQKILSEPQSDSDIKSVDKKQGEILEYSKKIKKKKYKNSVKKDKKENYSEKIFQSDIKPTEKCQVPINSLEKFPLAVQIILKKPKNYIHSPKEVTNFLNEMYPLELYFFLYPKIGLITASAKSSDQKTSSLQILHTLFAEDDGRYPIEYLKNVGISWNCDDEKPYSWVHFLAGIYDIAFANNFTEITKIEPENYLYDPTKITVPYVLSKIFNRMLAISQLNYQAEFLTKNHRIAPEIATNLNQMQQFKIIKEKTVIREFNPIIREFFISGASLQKSEFVLPTSGIFTSEKSKLNFGIPLQIPVFIRAEDGTFIKKYKENISPCKYETGWYFNILIERNGFLIRGYIEIGPDYPNSVPNFILKMENAKHELDSTPEDLLLNLDDKENFGYSHILREIESELMEHYMDFCGENERINLISHQIKKLTTCMEILVDTENEKATTLYKKGKTGIFRSRPFAYNPIKNIYEQR